MSGSEPRTSSVKRLLRELDIKPKKRLGQNFIVSEGLLQRIIAAAELDQRDAVLEIGAGLGTLTRRLAQRVRRVVALELDERLIPLLQRELAPYPHVEIVHGDILSIEPADLISPPYKVAGNLPYYITSAILRHLLETKQRPGLMVVTVQNEVADRLVAGPGAMSLLAVSVQFYGQPRIIARAPPSAFYPSPRVRSAVVRIEPYAETPATVDDVGAFFRIVRAGFSQRRKQLRNSLSQGLNLTVEGTVEALHRSGIDERQRAQELSVEQWIQLYRELTLGPLG